MRVYFVFRLIVDLVLSIALLYALIWASKAFKKERAKKAYVIYIPTVISLILILQVIFFTAPKLMDGLKLLNGQSSFKQIEVAEKRSLPGGITDTDGEAYYYNPISFKAEVGEVISVRYLPSSRFIVQIENQEQNQAVEQSEDAS